MENKELTVQGGGSMVVAQNITDIIKTNLGGQLNVGDLDRIKIPSGGGSNWEVQTLDGEESVKAIEGVIIYFQYQNAYWAQSIDETGGGDPPNCFAKDSLYGIGDPGGDCLTCPFNKFGSDRNGGKGKECKNMAVLFVLQKGMVLPVVLMLPPTSVKVIRKYMTNLSAAGLSYYNVMSSFELDKTKNEKGTPYSVVKPKSVDINPGGATPAERKRLPADVIASIEKYREAIIPALDRVVVEQTATE